MNFFASLVIDREPMTWAQMPDALVSWLQNAGGVAALGVGIVVLAGILSRDTQESPLWNLANAIRPLIGLLRICVGIAALGYAFLLLVWVGDLAGVPGLRMLLPRGRMQDQFTIGDWLMTLCGALALFVALTPIVFDLITRIAWSRIWAIARLSWKEAVRGRVIWVFGAMAIVFLFADWFVAYKPENQLRNYVRVVYWSMTPLFLLTAGLLGSFSIPNDVKNNSIHTIVTKPVEKFEVVLGRFFGYAGLMTVGLFVVSCVSLIYVLRGVNEEATRESFRARVPIYGNLFFIGTSSAKGDNVGREWTYRGYFSGPTRRQKDAVRQYAVWDFPNVPESVIERQKPILFEFAFDIFRLSKGEFEGTGVHCSFLFTDGTRTPQDLDALTETVKKESDKRSAAASGGLLAFRSTVQEILSKSESKDQIARSIQEAAEKLTKGHDDPLLTQALADIGVKFAKAKDAERPRLLDTVKDEITYSIDRALAKEYHVYHARGQEVTDYHTQEFAVPAGVLKSVVGKVAERKQEDKFAPAMRVYVSVDVAREAQMVGVAQQDFYLLAYEMPFWQNFLKGVLGMWCTHMLILGIAIACSTYLSSVISFLGTMFLFLAGLNVDYLKEIAEKRVDGGGPMESMIRIGSRMPIAGKLDDSPTKTVVTAMDDLFSWWIGRVLNLIPDVNRHDLHQYVANGFDISWLDVLLLDNALPLVGYLAPWAILAYYLMKYREIANPS